MLIANSKPICLIGYTQGTLSQEARHFISLEFGGDIIDMLPEEFLSLTDRNSYQYGVAFTLDTELRKRVIDVVDNENLDCIRYMHDTVICYTKDVKSVLGRGSFVAPYSSILLGATVGNHCIIETYCLVSHYATLESNVQLHSGVMIAGKTTVGANSVFNFRSTAVNALNICGGVEIGAASTVTKNLTEPGRYIGTPARRISDIPKFTSTANAN